MKVLLLIVIVLTYGCQIKPPQELNQNISWHKYKSDSLSLSFEYPKSHTNEINENDNSIIMRSHGFPYLMLSNYTMDQAKNHGLWAKHSVIETKKNNNISYDLYKYDHCDVFSCMRTLSYVTKENNRYFAIEFRTDSTDSYPIHQQLIDSIIIN